MEVSAVIAKTALSVFSEAVNVCLYFLHSYIGDTLKISLNGAPITESPINILTFLGIIEPPFRNKDNSYFSPLRMESPL